MFEQSRRLSEPLRWGRREKTVVAALVACVVLAVAGIVAFGSGGSASAKDCISVTFASTLGGAQRHACGTEARSICASPASYRVLGPQLAGACRHAGFATPRK